MTWQDPGGNSGSGDPSLDDTRTDWAGDALQAGQPPAEAGQAVPAGPPPSPPDAPSAPPPWSAPGPGQAPGHVPGMAPGYAPGMTWEPPAGSAHPVVGVAGLRFADVLPRFVAWFIDMLLLGLVGWGISLVLGGLGGGAVDWTAMFTDPEALLSGDAYQQMMLFSAVATLIGVALNLGYFVLSWSSAGRATPGMRLLRLQIGNAADGRTLDRGQAFRRWLAMGSWLDLAAVIPVLGNVASLVVFVWYLALLVTTASSPTRQGLHDRFAGTAIVQPSGDSGNGLVVGCLVIIAILVGIMLLSIVALIFLGGQVSTILSEVGNSI